MRWPVLGLATRLWRGPRTLRPSLRLEWRFVMIRWIGIAIVAPGLLLVDLRLAQPAVPWIILIAAAAFNAVVQHALHGLSHNTIAGLTSTMDSGLVAAMILATGGFDSPFTPFLSISVVAVAMRFGYVPSLAVAAVFIVANVVYDLSLGRPLDATLVFRASFLVLAALMASFIVEQGRADQAALQSSHDDLRRAYTDLAVAHQELLQLDEMKSDFIANVSHELRTPLTSVVAYSEMLLTYDDAPPEEQREFLRIIHTESVRLTRLVGDVLDITKIESGDFSLEREPIDVAELIETVGRAYRAVVEQQGLTLEMVVDPDLPVVVGDHDRLQQVLTNLLANAAKFTRHGTLRVSAERAGDELRIAVADTGIGIPPEHHERIFEKFHQVGDVMTEKPTGSGLGLAICRELVQAHGGRIWVESTPGVGSTFTVALPIDSRSAPVS
jgi:signal transduction histidine kinase